MDEVLNLKKTPVKEIKKLHLSNLQGVKKSLARLINNAIQPNANLSGIRTAIYGVNCLVSAYRIDFENRLERLEAIVNDKK